MPSETVHINGEIIVLNPERYFRMADLAADHNAMHLADVCWEKGVKAQDILDNRELMRRTHGDVRNNVG